MVWNQERERLSLASESRAEVKEKRGQCGGAIGDAEVMILSAEQRRLETCPECGQAEHKLDCSVGRGDG